MLGLEYPGGPVIERIAVGGDPTAVKFTRAEDIGWPTGLQLQRVSRLRSQSTFVKIRFSPVGDRQRTEPGDQAIWRRVSRRSLSDH